MNIFTVIGLGYWFYGNGISFSLSKNALKLFLKCAFILFTVYKQVDRTKTHTTWGTLFFTPGLLGFLGCGSLDRKCVINRGSKEWQVHVPTSSICGPFWSPWHASLSAPHRLQSHKCLGLPYFLPLLFLGNFLASFKTESGYLTSAPAFLISPGCVKCSSSEFVYYLDFFSVILLVTSP